MIVSPDLTSDSWPRQVIDDTLLRIDLSRLTALNMPHAASILKFVMLAAIMLSTLLTSTGHKVSFEQCDGTEVASWSALIDGESLAAELCDIEDSDEPLVSMWLAVAMSTRPIKWRVTSAEVDGAGPPSVPIPPPWIG